MIELKRAADSAEVEMVDLFKIDDVVYQVPAKPRVNVALRYFKNLQTMGAMSAEMALLEELLGEKGFKALSEFDGLTAKDLEALSEAAAQHALGALEDAPEGNGAGGSDS